MFNSKKSDLTEKSDRVVVAGVVVRIPPSATLAFPTEFARREQVLHVQYQEQCPKSKSALYLRHFDSPVFQCAPSAPGSCRKFLATATMTMKTTEPLAPIHNARLMRGFTLIELLVVIAIIAILAS